MKYRLNAILALAALLLVAWSSLPLFSQGVITGTIREGRLPRIAVTDFRGTG